MIPPQIRIGIVDDNEQFRETLRDMLTFESDFLVSAVWKHGAEALSGLEHTPIDVLLLDINMPLMNGVEANRRIQTQFPHVKTIMLSMHDDAGYVLETLNSGATGYLVKDGSVDEIVRAIRHVYAGQAMVHPQVTRTVLTQFQERIYVNDSWRTVLIDREMDVLRELSRGKSNEEVSDTLQIALKTVKHHVSNILSKLEVSDRTQAVIVAMKRKWLPPS